MQKYYAHLILAPIAWAMLSEEDDCGYAFLTRVGES
jgi:hypothetical protein